MKNPMEAMHRSPDAQEAGNNIDSQDKKETSLSLEELEAVLQKNESSTEQAVQHCLQKYESDLAKQKEDAWARYEYLSGISKLIRDNTIALIEFKKEVELKAEKFTKNDKPYLRFIKGSEEESRHAVLRKALSKNLDSSKSISDLLNKELELHRHLLDTLWDFRKNNPAIRQKPHQEVKGMMHSETKKEDPIINEKEQSKKEELEHIASQIRVTLNEIPETATKLSNILDERINAKMKSIFSDEEGYALIKSLKTLEDINIIDNPEDLAENIKHIAILFSEIESFRIPEEGKDDYESLYQFIKKIEDIQYSFEAFLNKLNIILDLKERSKDIDNYYNIMTSVRSLLDAAEGVKVKAKKIMNAYL